jgi:hypothetical protein
VDDIDEDFGFMKLLLVEDMVGLALGGLGVAISASASGIESGAGTGGRRFAAELGVTVESLDKVGGRIVACDARGTGRFVDSVPLNELAVESRRWRKSSGGAVKLDPK